MSKHTPGPWKASGTSSLVGSLISGGPNNLNIAAAMPLGDKRTTEANARLIAVAPELLEELMAYHVELCEGDDCSVCAVLAKAGVEHE